MHGILAPEWVKTQIAEEVFLAILEFELMPDPERCHPYDWFGFVVDEVWRFAPEKLLLFTNAKNNFLATALLELVPPQSVLALAERLCVVEDDRIRNAVVRSIWSAGLTELLGNHLKPFLNRLAGENSGLGAIATLILWRSNGTGSWGDVLIALNDNDEEFKEEILDHAVFLKRHYDNPPEIVRQLVSSLANEGASAELKETAQFAIDSWA